MTITTLDSRSLEPVLETLRAVHERFAEQYPGERDARQAVHTVYGGAHLFTADAARKLGDVAERFLDEYAGNFALFARALHLKGYESLPAVPTALEGAYHADAASLRRSNPQAWFLCAVYERVREKLHREPVEDYRLDFEDGYGSRPDDEEDRCAVTAAAQVAKGMDAGTLPPFIGIRIKPLNRDFGGRGVRTLDLFLTALTRHTGGALPPNFVITLPTVVLPEQVAALANLCDILEPKVGCSAGALHLEIMVETPQAIVGPDGWSPLPAMIAAARGRCVAAHFGVYDYTASLSVTAAHQTMQHALCDHARRAMQVSLAGTGVWLSDGATNVLPVPVHRAAQDETLTPDQLEANRQSVHAAWRRHFADVRHSLINAYYQGWDLHPAQLPTRYAALYSFFLESVDTAAERLRGFVAKAGQATLVGDVFDDAATGQGLLNFFLRGLNCGAITDDEALTTGLTLDELRSRSFLKIIEGRRRA